MTHPSFDLSESSLVSELMSPRAHELLADISAFAPTMTSFALATRLRKSYPADLVARALTLQELRIHGRVKFDRADEMFFTRPGLEQATSEKIAHWRAQRFANAATIADLCCGIGGDLIALASLPSRPSMIAVDLDPDHLAMAVTNAHIHVPGLSIQAIQSDVREVDLTALEVEAAFIDPARRDAGGRFSLGTGEPSLQWSLELANRISAVGIKTAPGIPHELIPEGWELETIALENNLKEAVLWSPALATDSRRATIVSDDQVNTISSSALHEQSIEIVEPSQGMWLYDPNPAITRAGLVEHLAESISAAKIDDQIGFLVAAEAVATPFARAHRIVASLPWNERSLKRILSDLDAGPVDVRRRGLAGDVDQISRRLRGSGSRPFYVAMTRYQDQPWALICDPLAARAT